MDRLDEIIKDESAPKQNDRLKDAVFAVMSTPLGRYFVWNLLGSTGAFRTSFVQDPYSTAFNEGQRNVGVMLLSMIDAYCPDLYLTMIKQSKEETDGTDTNPRT